MKSPTMAPGCRFKRGVASWQLGDLGRVSLSLCTFLSSAVRGGHHCCLESVTAPGMWSPPAPPRFLEEVPLVLTDQLPSSGAPILLLRNVTRPGSSGLGTCVAPPVKQRRKVRGGPSLRAEVI